MFNKPFIAGLVLTLLLLAVQVSPTYLELDVQDREREVYLGDEVTFDLTIRNLRFLDDRVMVEIAGQPEDWISDYQAIIFVPGRDKDEVSEVETSVTLHPFGETPGTFEYEISVTSLIPCCLRVSETVTLNVLRPLDIADFSVERSGNNLLLTILLDSKELTQADMDFTVKNFRGEVVDRFSLSSEVDGPSMVEESHTLPEGLLAGDYDVEVFLIGTPVRLDYMFTVPPLHKITESVKKTSSALYDEYEITIINEGNIKEPQYVTYKALPNNDLITGLITEPQDCLIRNGERVCRYVFQDLGPGESASLSYRLDYWSVYATYILILVALFTVILLSMRRATAPLIIKRHVSKGGGRHHVTLEVRNPFFHNLSNTIVRDWVSPLANVIHHEISMVKPLIRRSEAGTELIWRLGDIRPKETRIVSYPIKTLVSGSLKMPRAYIRYNKPNGRLRRVFSRPIIIEA